MSNYENVSIKNGKISLNFVVVRNLCVVCGGGSTIHNTNNEHMFILG